MQKMRPHLADGSPAAESDDGEDAKRSLSSHLSRKQEQRRWRWKRRVETGPAASAEKCVTGGGCKECMTRPGTRLLGNITLSLELATKVREDFTITDLIPFASASKFHIYLPWVNSHLV